MKKITWGLILSSFLIVAGVGVSNVALNAETLPIGTGLVQVAETLPIGTGLVKQADTISVG